MQSEDHNLSSNSKIVVLDGYDGSGKTTLALLLAEATGGKYIKFYNDPRAKSIWTDSERKRYEPANRTALELYGEVLEANRGHPLLILDRLWMTLFTLIPERFLALWEPLPLTFQCRAEPDIVISRLHARGEKVETPREIHLEMLKRFDDLAERYRTVVIDTSANEPEKSLKSIRSRIRN